MIESEKYSSNLQSPLKHCAYHNTGRGQEPINSPSVNKFNDQPQRLEEISNTIKKKEEPEFNNSLNKTKLLIKNLDNFIKNIELISIQNNSVNGINDEYFMNSLDNPNANSYNNKEVLFPSLLFNNQKSIEANKKLKSKNESLKKTLYTLQNEIKNSKNNFSPLKPPMSANIRTGQTAKSQTNKLSEFEQSYGFKEKIKRDSYFNFLKKQHKELLHQNKKLKLKLNLIKNNEKTLSFIDKLLLNKKELLIKLKDTEFNINNFIRLLLEISNDEEKNKILLDNYEHIFNGRRKKSDENFHQFGTSHSNNTNIYNNNNYNNYNNNNNTNLKYKENYYGKNSNNNNNNKYIENENNNYNVYYKRNENYKFTEDGNLNTMNDFSNENYDNEEQLNEILSNKYRDSEQEFYSIEIPLNKFEKTNIKNKQFNSIMTKKKLTSLNKIKNKELTKIYSMSNINNIPGMMKQYNYSSIKQFPQKISKPLNCFIEKQNFTNEQTNRNKLDIKISNTGTHINNKKIILKKERPCSKNKTIKKANVKNKDKHNNIKKKDIFNNFNRSNGY